LAKTYKKKIVAFSGPLYRSMKIRKREIILSFDYSGKGLVLRENSRGNEFQIAGEDKQFKSASVKVKGKILVISHPDISHPVAARYAFSNVSEASLFNIEGLPASSFRTDNWEE
jgi:sialate O-acetylesterase